LPTSLIPFDRPPDAGFHNKKPTPRIFGNEGDCVLTNGKTKLLW
jgi:hypothetical protein